MSYSTFLGRHHNSHWTHSPQARLWNKMAVFWGYFWDFVRVQKIEDLTKSKNFFAEVFQITCRFVLAKKNWGYGNFKPLNTRRVDNQFNINHYQSFSRVYMYINSKVRFRQPYPVKIVDIVDLKDFKDVTDGTRRQETIVERVGMVQTAALVAVVPRFRRNIFDYHIPFLVPDQTALHVLYFGKLVWIHSIESVGCAVFKAEKETSN